MARGLLALCKGIPFNSSYINVIDFNSLEEQENYFLSKANRSLTDYNYIRGEKNIKLPYKLDDIRGCNYLTFENEEDGKRYYYFIMKKNYISESATEIEIKLDVWQTYLFDYKLKESFIVREHIANDLVGANLIDENIATGEYVTIATERTNFFNNMALVVQCTEDMSVNNEDGIKFHPQFIDNVVTGCNYFVFTDKASILSILPTYLKNLDSRGKMDSIISMFYYPLDFLDFTDNDPITNNVYLYRGNTKLKKYTTNLRASIKDYTPRNKKLLTYPYTCLTLENGMANNIDIQYEFLNSYDFNFKVNLVPNSTALCYPTNYKNTSYLEKLTMDINMQIAWTGNAYANYLGSSKGSRLVNTLGNTALMVGSIASSNPLGFTAGAIGMMNMIGEQKDRETMPLQSKGNFLDGNILYSTGILDFTFKAQSITTERAQIIDDFFTKYGYKCNRVGVPNLKSRSNFNYIQLQDCNITGDIDNEYLEELTNIFHKGVTIWHNTNYYLNYKEENKGV